MHGIFVIDVSIVHTGTQIIMDGPDYFLKIHFGPQKIILGDLIF
jgi:hypothetical protein